MIFGKKTSKKKNAIVVGSGELGSRIAGDLSLEDWDVVVIDSNRNSFKTLPSYFGGSVINAYGTDLEKLEEAGIKGANLFVATTDSDEVNIVASQIAKSVYGVESVFTRIRDQEKTELCEKYSIMTICPPSLSINEIKKYLER